MTDLIGKTIRLRPILDDDFHQLHRIIAAHPETYRFSNIGHDLPRFTEWFELARQQNAYVVVNKVSGELLGSTRFYNLNSLVPCAYIGYTWYAEHTIGTQVNPEAKLLLLTHAFETLDYERVGFEVDSDNLRSRNAVLKLGAQHEGILRRHRRRWSDDKISDTYSFSILKSEWATVKAGLLARLGS